MNALKPGQLLMVKNRPEVIYILIEKCLPPAEKFRWEWASKHVWWKLLSAAGQFEYVIEEAIISGMELVET